jgi:predicted DNA-binding transcriptional regulator AlpA
MDDDEWMKIPATAELTGTTIAGLAQMRHRGDGPVFYRITKKTILYKRSEVIAWMESRAHDRTDRPVAAHV